MIDQPVSSLTCDCCHVPLCQIRSLGWHLTERKSRYCLTTLSELTFDVNNIVHKMQCHLVVFARSLTQMLQQQPVHIDTLSWRQSFSRSLMQCAHVNTENVVTGCACWYPESCLMNRPTHAC